MDRLQRRELQDGHACLTFDDALLCQFEIALPILEERRLTAFWFVYSSVFEGQIGKLELYRFFRTTCFDGVDEFYDVFFQRVSASEFAEAAQRVVDEPTISQTLASFPFYSVEDVKFRLVRDRALSPAQYERLMDGLIDDYGLDVTAAAGALWMSDDHLRYLSEHGHMVGLHSYSHPTALARLAPEEQADEYARNFRHVQRVCRQDPVAMAHPTNSYTEETLAILRKLGIRCGFRSNMSPSREGGALNPNPLEFAREDHANIMRRLAC
jgi:peptidoglycan/xylan/chitin deacetylase (PgdA/CDA1 family)